MRREMKFCLIATACALLVFSLGFFLGRRSAAVPVLTGEPATEAVRTADSTPDTTPLVTLPPEQTSTDADQLNPADTGAHLPDRTASDPATGENGLLDLNKATYEELLELPAIGPVLAQRILDYRAAAGGFQTIEELLEIDGIGQKTLETLLDYCTVAH